MDEQSKRFVIVKFKKMPIVGISPLQCVPASWIKCRIDDVNVAVSFPSGLTLTNKSCMRNGKEPALRWQQFSATIEHEVDTYKDGELKLVLAGAAAPLLRSENALSYLHTSEPSTSSTPKKPKPQLNISAINVETKTSSNETIEVSQQLLVELYQTWE
ncbi:unnamed protein product [Euphydryas editha]|uniref:Uncharacterized protein n=1 Tax=Euphydryas editha TaxID=104508 RepID=A0AAU9TTT0_EUPED|nr:unnamed protein product [Euphydryas editha]